MVMASSSASRRSSIRVSFRNRRKPRMRSRAAWYSSSSLACSGQEMARAEEEHMEHLLKTSQEKVARGRNKSKHYFRLSFARVRCQPPARNRDYQGPMDRNGIAEILNSGNYHEICFRNFPDQPARLRREVGGILGITPRWIRYSDYNQSPPEMG
jgi:hypothetical protein